MAVQNFDKLNILDSGLYDIPEEHRRSMPYEEYFGDMYLTGEQVEKRIVLARQFYDPLVLFLLLMIPVLEYGYVQDVARDSLVNQLAMRGIGDEDYRENLASELVLSTLDNPDDPWFLSEDRATWIAENESNTLLNGTEFFEAVERGMTRKQWKGIADKRERKTHRKLNDTILPILEYFSIGNAQGLFAKDTISPLTTLPEHPRELINCRCSTIYLP